MCGRYQRRSDKQRIVEAFQLGKLDELELADNPDGEAGKVPELGPDWELAPNYNVAPSTMQPVIVWDETHGMRMLRMMYWRFLPPFCTDPKKLKFDTINASGEKLLSSTMWRKAFLHRRCLVPADTFVEWKRVDAKTRRPVAFGMKSEEPFGLGGIWQNWRSPDGKTSFDTFAIVTVEPNEIVHELTDHDRMPLIVAKKDYTRWLRDGDVERPPVDLLRPFDAEWMKAWRLNLRVNSVRNNDASLMDAAGDDPAPGQLSMFE